MRVLWSGIVSMQPHIHEVSGTGCLPQPRFSFYSFRLKLIRKHGVERASMPKL